MKKFREDDYRDLARVLRGWVAPRVPDWTDANDSDPGITILELLASIAESLAAWSNAMPERGRLSAARLARSALIIAGGKEQPEPCALVRNRYYSGQLLTAQDLQLEQDYIRGRLRRHNRELHSVGIVRGLKVSVHLKDQGAGEQVVVQPGFAIDPDGEEIKVCSKTAASLPQIGSQLFVILSLAERFTHPVPASDDEQVQFTRVEETFELHTEAMVGETGIALACLIRTADGWKLDETFAVPRAGRYQK
jgi:hypothetical protein